MSGPSLSAEPVEARPDRLSSHLSADRLRDWISQAIRRRVSPLTTLDPQPGDEADDAEPAIDDVHDRRRVIAGRQQQRNADQVNCDPDQPELHPAAGHPVGGQNRPGQDPGVSQRTPGAQRLQHEVEDRGQQDRADEQLEPTARTGPLRAYPDALLSVRLLELVPADPAVDADDDEEDLAAGLALQIQVVRGVEGAPRAVPTKTVNSKTLPTMPTGHAATLRRMPRMALASPNPLPMISRHRMVELADVQLGLQQLRQQLLRSMITHSSGRTNAGVDEIDRRRPWATRRRRSA